MGSLYQPLDQSRSQFRLLRLGGLDADGIRCEMKSFSLVNDDLPPWKALSYRWGDDEPVLPVFVNGHPVHVRMGLFRFFAQMMIEKKQDWYFVDALCIDQDNDSEKVCQVQQMGEIYRRAEEVVAWLIFELFEHDEDDILSEAVYHHDEYYHDISSLSPKNRESAVLYNSYWSRLWIVQEVLYAKRLTIRIGDAEVDWSNLIPEKVASERDGLPIKNDNIMSVRKRGVADPYANRTSAQNILSYRRCMTDALRAGSRLPFHKAVDFFSMQRCSKPHDVVFGYLGLTNSRIQTDYSTPILDLFVATLADYLLSAGFNKQHVTQIQAIRINAGLSRASDLLAPLLAFGLDPCDPVVQLLVHEVTKFFAPGFESLLTTRATAAWWGANRLQSRPPEALINSVLKTGLKTIWSLCVGSFKYAWSEYSEMSVVVKEIAARQKVLEEEDTVMSAPGPSDVSKTYSQWAAHARAISEQIWQRFTESGEHADGDMGDEPSTLIT